MTINQLSTRGEIIQLEVISGQLLFIDPGYFDEIAGLDTKLTELSRADTKTFIREMEKLAFPYGGASLLGFRQLEDSVKTYKFDPISLLQYDSDKPEGEIIESRAVQKSITAFGVDSASFLIIDMANFDALLPILRSDDLFAMKEEPSNTFIHKINSILGNHGWAFIASPGIGKGYDFVGDGSYYVNDSEDFQETLY